MKNLKKKLYDGHYLYFSGLERERNLILENYNIKNPKARSLFSLPISLYLMARSTFNRTINLILIFGDKIFEHPSSYYQKKIEREERNEK